MGKYELSRLEAKSYLDNISKYNIEVDEWLLGELIAAETNEWYTVTDDSQ